MAIIWRDSMSVDNIKIDEDHKHLISLLNSVEKQLENPEDTASLQKTFAQLKIYTIEHFQREEILQLRIRFPKAAEHKRIHRTLVKQLDSIITSVKAKGIAAQAEDISALLRRWLIDHVLQEDLPMKPYFAKFSSDLS